MSKLDDLYRLHNLLDGRRTGISRAALLCGRIALPQTNENGEPKFAVCIGGLGLSALPLLPIVPTIGMPDTVSMIAPSYTKATT